MFSFFKNYLKKEEEIPPSSSSEPLTFVTDYSWRNNPSLNAKFHEEYPDDILVIVHEGDVRITERQLESIWVRVTGHSKPYFEGILLNQPHQLSTLSLHSKIIFKIETGCEYPVRVLPEYIKDRADWFVKPCESCGFTETLSSIAELTKLSFPNNPKGAIVEAFTSRCNFCGGTQIIYHKNAQLDSIL